MDHRRETFDGCDEAGFAESLALSDLVVVAVEQFGAGPWATLQLADLGATVIKIEDPTAGGDVGRYVPPFASGQDSLYFEAFNRGKLSVSLDLTIPAGRQAFEDLVSGADAVFSNLRGDVVGKLRLRYSDLCAVNPHVVCCSLSGFGQSGPRRAEGAYDHTIQALAGWQSLTGDPDAPPTKSGLSMVDFTAGYVAAFSLLAGVNRARRLGRGGDVDLSLFEVAIAQLNYVGTWTASRGHLPVRRERSSHPSLVPFGNFPTRDGWLAIACPKQSLWRRLCGALERDDLAEDPRFADFAARDQHREELQAMLDAILSTGTSAEWLERFQIAGVPCAPINDVSAALADPQLAARGGLPQVEHPVLGTVRHVPSPLRVPGGTTPATLAPGLGEHTEQLLRERCGYGEEQLDAIAGPPAFAVGSPD
jgi:crotonobetainyl-CoA:carnitine CoA-transferase CaiB-like acyl-CoA transferase